MAEHTPTEPGTNDASKVDRLVYVMPAQMARESTEGLVTLRQLWDILWAGKWRVLGAASLFGAIAAAYALLATEWYRAEVLLAPSEDKTTSSLPGQLGGLAALAGVSIGGGDAVEGLATLRSREFAKEFIEDNGLLTVLLAHERDELNDRWLEDDPKKQPDIRDAVKYFHDEVLSVSENRQTSLVTIAVEWTDPELAADWAAVLVGELNARLRARALRDAEANVEYLQGELAQTNVLTLQQAIGRLLESELQKLMLARGNEEFAFRIIDKPSPPKESVRPNKILTVALGTILGGLIGLAWVLIAGFSRPPKISS